MEALGNSWKSTKKQFFAAILSQMEREVFLLASMNSLEVYYDMDDDDHAWALGQYCLNKNDSGQI